MPSLTNHPEEGYLRKVDFSALSAVPPDQRFTERLLDHSSGARTCTVSYIKTPPRGGSPEGMHIHDVDQVFYVLSGTMSLEIAGERFEAGPGTLVIFPAGVPHRNWNGGTEPTVHLSFNAPLPDPNKPFARPAPL
jgi:mannose-6-phosphate isomerase-like protein (cupin superfamily)